MKKINWIVLIVLYSCGGMLILLLHAAIRVVTSNSLFRKSESLMFLTVQAIELRFLYSNILSKPACLSHLSNNSRLRKS